MAYGEVDPILGLRSANPFATGTPVYGNGTSAPTRGPVDISGYRERDLMLQGARKRALATAQQQMQQQLFGGPMGLPGRT